jgi:hypothetical protein
MTFNPGKGVFDGVPMTEQRGAEVIGDAPTRLGRNTDRRAIVRQLLAKAVRLRSFRSLTLASHHGQRVVQLLPPDARL